MPRGRTSLGLPEDLKPLEKFTHFLGVETLGSLRASHILHSNLESSEHCFRGFQA